MIERRDVAQDSGETGEVNVLLLYFGSREWVSVSELLHVIVGLLEPVSRDP